MNKLLIKRLLVKNKWYALTCFIFILLMFTKSKFIIFTGQLCTTFVIYKAVSSYAPVRFTTEDTLVLSVKQIYSLMPIEYKEVSKFNIFNALIWGFVHTVILYISVICLDVSCDNLTITLVALLLQLLPLFLIFIDTYLTDIKTEMFFFFSIVAYAMLVSSFFSSIVDLPTFAIRSMLLICGVAILQFCLILMNKLQKKGFNRGCYIGLRSRIFKIERTTKYYLYKKRYVFETISSIWIYWAIRGESVFVYIVLFGVNLLLIGLGVSEYFDEDNLVQLLPISLKEKKFTCNVFSIARIFIVNLVLALLLTVFRKFSASEFLMTFIYWVSIGVFMYSLYITYFHRGKDPLLAIVYALAFIVIIAVLYSLYKFIGHYVVLILMVLAIILIYIDYHHPYQQCILD